MRAPSLTSRLADEGARLEQGAIAAEIDGKLAGLLIGERTRSTSCSCSRESPRRRARFVDAVAGTHAKIIDTRKTHPGLRVVEKYAVRCRRRA